MEEKEEKEPFHLQEYYPALLFIAFACIGFATGFLGIVLSVSWAYVCVKLVNHYILHKKPEDMIK